MIVDESHYLRTTNRRENDADTTESTVLAAKRAKRVIMLSGTPSLSRPFDLYRQVPEFGSLFIREQSFVSSSWLNRIIPWNVGG